MAISRKTNNFYLFSYVPGDTGKLEIEPENPVRTKEIIQKKLKQLEAYLQQKLEESDEGIVLGCEDFFESTTDDACFDLETFYYCLVTDFIKLSSKFPKYIICPGSMYVSAPIPDEHGEVRFDQDNIRNQLLSKTTCYVTNVMPVLFNGQLLRIIRKGEKIEFNPAIEQPPAQVIAPPLGPQTSSSASPAVKPKNNSSVVGSKKNISTKIKIAVIDEDFPTQIGKLKVVSYHEDELTDIKTKDQSRIGVCYLGKTLLPNEQKYIDKYLKNNPNVPDLKHLFDHELEINNSRYFILICGEFIYKDSTAGNLLRKNTYDFVLHSTVGGDVFPYMREGCEVYLHSDFGNDNKILIHEQEQEMSVSENKEVVVRSTITKPKGKI